MARARGGFAGIAALAAAVGGLAPSFPAEASSGCLSLADVGRELASGQEGRLSPRETVRRLREAVADRRANRLEQANAQAEAVESERTVFPEDERARDPRAAERRYVRKGAAWSSAHGSDTQNPDGDPRWTRWVLGPHVARLLGFRQPDSGTMILPLAHRINEGIARIRKLWSARKDGGPNYKAELSLGFYESSGKETGAEYLTRFAYEGLLPISDDLRLHDSNFHVPALLIPDPLIRHARNQVRAFLEFKAYLRRSHPDLLAAPLAAQTLERMEAAWVGRVDMGTGNFSVSRVDGGLSAYGDAYGQLAMSGLAPIQALRELLRSAGPADMDAPGRARAWGMRFAEFHRAIAEFESDATPVERSRLQAALPMSPAEFELAVRRRANALEAAALAL